MARKVVLKKVAEVGQNLCREGKKCIIHSRQHANTFRLNSFQKAWSKASLGKAYLGQRKPGNRTVTAHHVKAPLKILQLGSQGREQKFCIEIATAILA